ncbi:hypothetical protein BH11MYX1_BH11MYX1_07210 [soil metagenome]
MRRPRTSERGFTLVELMISLVIFSFAVAGVLAVAVSMSQGFREQRASMTAESAVRVPIDFIADAIRQASPGSPANIIYDPNTCTTTGAQVYNNAATPSGIAPNTDKLDVVFASGAVVTSTREIYTNNTSLTITDGSQLSAGDSIVISDGSVGMLAKITAVSGNVLTLVAPASCAIAIPTNAAGPYAAGSLVIRAQHALFYVGSVSDGGSGSNPTLLMDPDGKETTADAEPMAEGVEDLQLVKAEDVNGDGYIGTEGSPTLAGDDWMFNSATDVADLSPTLRAIRVTMVARTLSGLIGNLKAFNRPQVEDHAAAAVNSDNFRRRILRETVEIRNTSASP